MRILFAVWLTNFQPRTCFVEKLFMRSKPLPPQCVGQDFQSGFSNHLLGVSRTQSRTHRAFQSAEKAFHRPASTKSRLLQGPWFHLRAPFSSNFAVGSPLN